MTSTAPSPDPFAGCAPAAPVGFSGLVLSPLLGLGAGYWGYEIGIAVAAGTAAVSAMTMLRGVMATTRGRA
jgi:hypothetical protein